MTPSWYDVLGLEQDATPDEIRAAWRSAIDGLDPTDRRFRSANKAAEVLLDPVRRAQHDAELAIEPDDDVDGDVDDDTAGGAAGVVPPTTHDAPTRPGAPVVATTSVAGSTDYARPSTSVPTRPGSPRLLGATVVAGVVALALLVLAVVGVVGRDDTEGSDASSSSDAGGLPDDAQVEAARAAAEAAAVPVLSYDYRTLDQDKQEAGSYLTDSYRAEYDRLFEGAVRINAPTTKTVVTAQVIASGIVRTGPDRVDVLLFVNRPYKNKQREDESKDQVTMRMVDQDDTWLVDCMITVPGDTCD